jgi:hypothetical protein
MSHTQPSFLSAAGLPALFGDLVCAMAAAGRPAVVDVKFLSTNQPGLDAFVAARTRIA